MRLHGLAMVAATFTASWGSDVQQRHLTVLVIDQAGVPSMMLRKAGLTAQMVFQKAGIQMEWLICASESGRRCDQDGNVAYPNLFIVLPPRSSDGRESHAAGIRESRAFGVAVLATGQRTGNIAYVSYGRVETAACGANGFRSGTKVLCDAPSGQLLANIMAHEAAHLLGLTHSHRGLMTTDWTEWDVKQASHVTLLFSKSEAQQLQDGVAARLAKMPRGSVQDN